MSIVAPSLSRRETEKSWSVGLSGVQSAGFPLIVTEALPETTFAFWLLTTTNMPSAFSASTSIRTVMSSISAIGRTFVMCAFGTASSQTVCQIPVTGVYQIPCGLLSCLPMPWTPSFVGSQTLTTSSCLPSALTARVRSTVKGQYPPWWLPTLTSLRKTSARQSTAPNCRRICLPAQSAGISNVVLYHRLFFAPTDFATPESADSAQNGTRICP